MVPFRTARSWCVSTFVLVIVAISSSRALAQTTLNPTTAVFSASSDQTTTLPDGTPVLQYYQLDLYLSGASAPFQSNSLGKPAPDSTGTITVDLRSMFAGWPVPGTVYVADVAAVGPGVQHLRLHGRLHIFSVTNVAELRIEWRVWECRGDCE